MRRLQHLRPAKGARRKNVRRGSGRSARRGGTSGRGEKGQKHRSKVKNWFEGGQMPIQRRLTHKGFNNRRFSKEYQIVNVSFLQRFEDGTEVTPDVLKEAGLISSRRKPVKILGDGELERKLKVKAHAFSEKAAEMIRSTGGEAVVLD
ncbi:50S ribosomal protein L15 [Candidatus Fermentibacteria bacterium]|nr:50S ribosomal protein L15 [Candidatus Fermentibacteria bacterium]